MSKLRLLPIPMGVGPSPSEFYTKAEIDAMLASYAQLATSDLVNYYLKSETYSQAEIQALIGQITSFEVVATLPVSDIKTNVIYLLGPSGTGADKYEEYIYSNSQWVKIGETSIDLSNYVTVTQLNTALGNYTTTLDLNTLLAGKQDTLTAGEGITISSNVISADSNVISMTQAEYDALGTNVDPDVVYIITDATPVTLATVASTGSYNDLTDKPTIPTVPTLATVATSGSYNDLTDKPTIPTANDKLDVSAMTQAELLDLYTNYATIMASNDLYYGPYPVTAIRDYVYGGYTMRAITYQLEATINANGYPEVNTRVAVLAPDGTIVLNNDNSVEMLTKTQIETALGNKQDTLIAGQNITIGTDNVISATGGGSTSNAWYGSQYQFDTLGTKDPDTDYYISDIYYSEIKGTPDLSSYATKTEMQTADTALAADIAGKADNIVFLGTNGIADVAQPLEGTVYAVEGVTVPLTFTLADSSTVTYNFVVD